MYLKLFGANLSISGKLSDLGMKMCTLLVSALRKKIIDVRGDVFICPYSVEERLSGRGKAVSYIQISESDYILDSASFATGRVGYLARIAGGWILRKLAL